MTVWMNASTSASARLLAELRQWKKGQIEAPINRVLAHSTRPNGFCRRNPFAFHILTMGLMTVPLSPAAMACAMSAKGKNSTS